MQSIQKLDEFGNRETGLFYYVAYGALLEVSRMNGDGHPEMSFLEDLVAALLPLFLETSPLERSDQVPTPKRRKPAHRWPQPQGGDDFLPESGDHRLGGFRDRAQWLP